jgi:hypothetical protein
MIIIYFRDVLISKSVVDVSNTCSLQIATQVLPRHKGAVREPASRRVLLRTPASQKFHKTGGVR